MKKTIYILTITFYVFGCSPKINPIELNNNLTEYSNLMSNGKFEKAIEYLPAEFWESYEKEKFISVLKRVENKHGNISMKRQTVQYISKTIKSDGKYFKIINYSAEVELNSSNISNQKLQKIKSTFGSENVKLDTINNIININQSNKIVSVFDKDLKTWKFLEFKPKTIEKIYGTETLDEILKYVR